MLQSSKFEVTIFGTHGILIPLSIALQFINAGQTRVAIKGFFKTSEIFFHGKLRLQKEIYILSFGKRYQKALGVSIEDSFKLQLFEDTSKYGVEMPESFEAVLKNDWEAMEQFENLTSGKKRSLIYYIKRFKNVQTQIDKALIISENLKMRITDQKQLIKKN